MVKTESTLYQELSKDQMFHTINGQCTRHIVDAILLQTISLQLLWMVSLILLLTILAKQTLLSVLRVRPIVDNSLNGISIVSNDISFMRVRLCLTSNCHKDEYQRCQKVFAILQYQ